MLFKLLHSKQTLEWNSPLYINFMDYIKAFDSVQRQSLWQLMRHYGIPELITKIVRNSYEEMSCRVAHGKELTDSFQVLTGVRQGCLLLPFLFLLALDWIMSTSTANRKNGIQWTPWKHLEDLDFADDVALKRPLSSVKILPALDWIFIQRKVRLSRSIQRTQHPSYSVIDIWKK